MSADEKSPRDLATSELPGPVDPDQPDIPSPDDLPDQPDMPGPEDPDQPPPPLRSGDRPAGIDAREDPDKQKENRRKLGVDDEHLTADMKKHHRGTFP